ncbi:hypothetical protein AM501_06205 [Aneurinibacillus migulanus]|uniref:Uncharacterized protein n=1 Tax=Aneurinibacillus migulanus TaxID=47500 RepID=A0A0D1X953_ANEMI|nr:hypothetical protein TS64_25690 [Aneurinibacillus migulanus]KIV59003.1 hypothetical protein TS65_03450 [Aneurinibacillus migulanus]KON99294.1 hypothetical protein AF333_00730 [Aneurinibacillus migulanus]KPD09094.1 hypothetical protein AM501_06205 [Aneurinibacillus migulanus]
MHKKPIQTGSVFLMGNKGYVVVGWKSDISFIHVECMVQQAKKSSNAFKFFLYAYLEVGNKKAVCVIH